MNKVYPQLSSENESSMNIFLVGNNPTEIEHIYKKLKSIDRYHFHAYISFDVNKLFRRIRKFQPLNVLVDDRLDPRQLNHLLKRLRRNPWTKNIPVILLKSDNRDSKLKVEADEYMLKSNISPESLYNSILNSRRYRKTAIYFKKYYRRSRGLLAPIYRLLGKVQPPKSV